MPKQPDTVSGDNPVGKDAFQLLLAPGFSPSIYVKDTGLNAGKIAMGGASGRAAPFKQSGHKAVDQITMPVGLYPLQTGSELVDFFVPDYVFTNSKLVHVSAFSAGYFFVLRRNMKLDEISQH